MTAPAASRTSAFSRAPEAASRSQSNRSSSRHDDGDFEDVNKDEKSVSASSDSADELNCNDFSSQREAQDVLDEDSDDPNGLDNDGNGRACEESFRENVRTVPRGGVQTGGGGTLATHETGSTGGPAENVARIVGPPLALALVVGGLVGLRRTRRTG
jgi:hypothetical protein